MEKVLDIPADVAIFCGRIGATLVSCNSDGGQLEQTWTIVFTVPGNAGIDQPAETK